MHSSVEVSVFIQARMGSTRLPGKVLMELAGKPVLEHIVARLRQSKSIEQRVVVTSTEPRDQILLERASQWGIGAFAGSEENVLNRYYEASKRFPSRHIVRVTADCPLLDPLLVDDIVSTHLKEGNHYTSFVFDRHPNGIGAEIFRSKDLETAEREAKEPYEREHVTPFFYLHPERFKIGFIAPDPKIRRPDLRLTLDTAEDLALIRAVYGALYQDGRIFATRDVVEFLDAHPELLELNRHILQKPLINR